MDKYILTIKKEDLKKWPKGTDMNSCLTNLYMLNSKISYYESIINTNREERINRDCDIIAFDVNNDIIYNYDIIKKNDKYLFCIPLVSLCYTDSHINTFGNNIKIYHIFLIHDERNELAFNSYYFTNNKFIWKGRIYNDKILSNEICFLKDNNFMPEKTKELFTLMKKSKEKLYNKFEKMMKPIKEVLMKSNVKLSNRSRLVLFLLRHHAIPPKDIKEYDNIESILEYK